MGLVDKGRLPKPLTSLFNLGRAYSLGVSQWGLACCAIEMGAAFASPRYDVMRLGVIPLPASPRQADLVVVSGTVTDKDCAASLMGAEAEARRAKRGIWADPAAIKNAESPGDILARIGRFTVVEGRVLSVRQAGATTYLNFGARFPRRLLCPSQFPEWRRSGARWPPTPRARKSRGCP